MKELNVAEQEQSWEEEEEGVDNEEEAGNSGIEEEPERNQMNQGEFGLVK